MFENEIYFCRSCVSKVFVRVPKNPLNEEIILQNEEGQVFCLEHRTWEKCNSLKVVPETAEAICEFECGRKIQGFYSDLELFSCRVKINESKSSPLLIEENLIDKKRLSDFEQSRIFLKNIPTKSVQFCYGRLNITNKTRKLHEILNPELEIVKNYAENLLWQHEKNEFKLSGEKPKIEKNVSKDKWLNILAGFPCEPGIASVYDIIPETQKIKIDDRNAWFSLCNILGIKSFQSLRKHFSENPLSVIMYKNILFCGFKDKNVINDMLSDKFCEYIFPGEYLIEKNEHYSDSSLKFFFEKALEKRTERAIWKTVLKNLESYLPQQNENNGNQDYWEPSFPKRKIFGLRAEEKTDSTFLYENNYKVDNSDFYERRLKRDYESASSYFSDAARMFQKYFEYLPDEIIHSVIFDGLSRYNHDVLSKYNPKLKNVVLKYMQAELSLEDSVLGYDFYLPKESFDLVSLGTTLHNCVGSYIDRVLEKFCTIVAAKKDGNPVLCIEVRNLKTVHQCRADYNSNPNKNQKEAFDIWCRRHNLVFYGNKW